jgi:hypothetical protein
VPHRLTASWLGKTRHRSGIRGIFFPDPFLPHRPMTRRPATAGAVPPPEESPQASLPGELPVGPSGPPGPRAANPSS